MTMPRVVWLCKHSFLVRVVAVQNGLHFFVYGAGIA